MSRVLPAGLRTALHSRSFMIRSFRGTTPRIADSAYIDDSAQVIGDVVIGERSSIWPNVTIRGDVNYIRVGDECSVQDNTVIHVDHQEWPCILGDRVTVGHSAVLHGCTVEAGALIGIGAIVLNGARIGPGAVVAAGALVPEGMEVPPDALVMGAPAKMRRQVTVEEQARFAENCDWYVQLSATYKEEQF